MKREINPWFYVPTTYFAEGLPYILINSLAVILYKRLNVSNELIAFWTSWLYLPWAIKMFWSPFVDIYLSKRKWIILTQSLIAISIILISISLGFKSFLLYSMIGFTLLAFLSATQDVAIDGFYMLSMDDKKQAFFIGIRTFAYRLSMLFGSGFLVFWAGKMEASSNNIILSWKIILVTISLIMAFLFFYHKIFLPFPEEDKGKGNFDFSKYFQSIISYFKQDGIWLGIAFIILYRFGEAMLIKISAPFLLDPLEKGGMGLTTSEIGLAYGTIGLTFLIIGNLLGGWVISKWGLKRTILIMALFLNIPDLVYVYMAYNQNISHKFIYLLVAFEQFGYGLGVMAFTYYLIQLTNENYKTVHFAISTGIMAFAMMLPGMISGYFQVKMGYPHFFIYVFLLTIPGMILIPFLKYKN